MNIGVGCLAGLAMLVIGIIHVISGEVHVKSLQLSGWPARIFGIIEIVFVFVLLFLCYKAVSQMENGIVLKEQLLSGNSRQKPQSQTNSDKTRPARSEPHIEISENMPLDKNPASK